MERKKKKSIIETREYDSVFFCKQSLILSLIVPKGGKKLKRKHINNDIKCRHPIISLTLLYSVLIANIIYKLSIKCLQVSN